MRTSRRTTWQLVAAIAAATCIHTGCGISRMGHNVSNMSLSRPRLLNWRKDKPDSGVARASVGPPRSSIPPVGGDIAGSRSRSFPSEPAPVSNYDYASTGNGGDYTRGNTNGYSRTENYNDSYVARGDSSAGSQRGFYDGEYQGDGGSSRFAGSDARGGYDDDRNTRAAGGGYDTYGGSQSPYGPSYGGHGARDQNYQQVADRRGEYDSARGAGEYGGGYDNGSQYGGGGQYGGGSQYGGADYSAGQSGGGSAYGDTRQVTPGGGGGGANYDDYRSPAQGGYGDNYGAGGNYDATYGGSSARVGASPPAAGASSKRWLPGSTGSTTPYDQKQLSPPTNNSWGN